MHKINTRSLLSCSKSSLPARLYGLFTPDYLNVNKRKIPIYPALNFQITGYVYPILENYQKLIHKTAEIMDFDVLNSYAIPQTTMKIVRYKPDSSALLEEYNMCTYERHVLVDNITTVRFPIFLRIIEAALPEGVSLNIEEWSEIKDELRYIPDKKLLDLKAELDDFTTKK